MPVVLWDKGENPRDTFTYLCFLPSGALHHLGPYQQAGDCQMQPFKLTPEPRAEIKLLSCNVFQFSVLYYSNTKPIKTATLLWPSRWKILPLPDQDGWIWAHFHSIQCPQFKLSPKGDPARLRELSAERQCHPWGAWSFNELHRNVTDSQSYYRKSFPLPSLHWIPLVP